MYITYVLIAILFFSIKYVLIIVPYFNQTIIVASTIAIPAKEEEVEHDMNKVVP